MKTVTLICVGKLKESYWREAVAEYQKRLSAFCRFEIIELPEYRLPENPSAAEIEKALDSEGTAILSKIPAGAAVVPLCIEGKPLSSPALSELFQKWAIEGKSKTVFIIGSSFGLSDRVKAAAAYRLSMSPMTFPHQLARVMLCEQIYRAMQIEMGGKYHK